MSRNLWQQTASGGMFYPWRPRAADVRIDDIAHALARENRYGGHFLCESYSVAQHSVIVSRIVQEKYPRLAQAALLHDAAEAYIKDLPRGLKRGFPEYEVLEQEWLFAIATALGVDPDGLVVTHPVIKQADEVALATERRDLLAPPPAPWENDTRSTITPLLQRIYPLRSPAAKKLFLRRWKEVSR